MIVISDTSPISLKVEDLQVKLYLGEAQAELNVDYEGLKLGHVVETRSGSIRAILLFISSE